MQPHAPGRQLVLQFLKGSSAYTIGLFFEQESTSQLQTQKESSIDTYMRKVKRTIRSDEDLTLETSAF